jgi:gliding motility-associated-like protein
MNYIKKFLLAVSIGLIFLNLVDAQIIYLSDTDGKILSFDLKKCEVRTVCGITASITDIAFSPDQKIYIIYKSGREIAEVNLTTCVVTDIVSIPQDFFVSLTCDASGNLYAAGSAGTLLKIDPITKIVNNLGIINFMSAGDLTFNKGDLYMAATGNRIVKVNLSNPSQSEEIFITTGISDRVFGIFSYSENCFGLAPYLLAGQNVYSVDLENQTTKLVCTLPVRTTGGTSNFEFLGSNPLLIDTIKVINPDCNVRNGELSVEVSGGFPPTTFAIDGITFSANPVFKNLGEGEYTISVKDNSGCIGQKKVTLKSPNRPEIINVDLLPSDCNGDNTLNIFATAVNGGLEFSLDGRNYNPSNVFTNLTSGNKRIFIRDALGCTDTSDFTIPGLAFLQITKIQAKPTSCGNKDGEIILTTIPDKDVKFTVDGNTFSDGNLRNLSPGIISIILEDAKGCKIDTTVLISENCGIFLPEIFSPNRDGNNDTYRAYSKLDFKVNYFRIFDRWGNLLFENKNLRTSSPSELWWDGKSKGILSNESVFICSMEYEDELGTKYIVSKDFILVK